MKVQQAAIKAGSTPHTFCDRGAEQFKSLAERADISYDIFMRTTDPRHVEAVQYTWYILREKNLIYASKHEGWYAVSDETFYPESQVHLVIDPQTGRKHMASMETGKEVEWTSEPNYHFRLSAFRERLLEFYEQNPKWIDPQSRMNKVVQEVTEGLNDLSVSRPYERLSWGVPVPDDSSQTMYVWLDALLNYATAVGYPWPPGRSHEGGWPADCHVIGKDILRFHCIYWPAFLLALEIPLPSKVIAHAHWTMNKEKMSKSIGNVVNPFFALDRFGSDVMRFYLAYDGRIANDADYDNFRIIERYKKILQGGLGNLASRIMKSKGWNVPVIIKDMVDGGQMSEPPPDPKDAEQWQMLNRQTAHIDNLMQKYSIPYGLHAIMQIVVEVCRPNLQLSSLWMLTSGCRQIVIFKHLRPGNSFRSLRATQLIRAC
jgi:methionyl-tRNA synthetase